MNKVLISIFSGALALGVAAAQVGANPASGSPPEPKTAMQGQTSQPGGSGQSAKVTRVAPGSVIPVTLTKTIDAKKAKTGDEVVAKVTQDMKSNSGEVIFAKDTRVMGHVTEAQPRSKEQKESQVGIAFDHAVMQDGSQLQVPMSIQAIIGPQNDQNNDGGGYGAAATPGASPGPASGGRPGMAGSGMGGSTPASIPTSSSNGSDASEAKSGAKRSPITAQTEGVVGISNLTLSLAAVSSSAQGSVVSSEKNNVKLESGTLMLLRVNQ
jgi:hypothetical protein